MALKQGEPCGRSEASRPIYLSLQQVLDAVLDSENDEDIQSGLELSRWRKWKWL